MTILEHVGLVYRSPQAVLSSIAIALPKGVAFRLVAYYNVPNRQVESMRGPQPNLKHAFSFFVGTNCLATDDMIESYG